MSEAPSVALGVSHYIVTVSDDSSFFTLDDFQEMKSVGLNSVRIPVGYWAVDVQDWEPYVNGQVSSRPEERLIRSTPT